ncbi:hypothetical protein [Psychrobacillus vulpis]|uniref:Lipoprotein n=1 Tax=Psychrobacillus vulpis TaxID=2325572 RepID=A0A544TE05_9BACI|nr:hypothetical protein [Psychrobacillus vulpis]TQR15684.1 hypothetical protein FG384_19155 [Psychrobacillus vulpis]
MNHLLKLWLSLLILFVISGCGPTSEIKESGKDSLKETAEDPIISDPLPLSWINYGGEKYVFNRIIPKDEVDMSQIVSTNALTALGDGAESGNEIFLYKKDGSLFIIDNTGPTEQWANFTKNN